MIEELEELGAALGGLAWVQGPGGNVSVKDGDALVVKASGTRLSSVASDTGHVRTSLAVATRALDGDLEADRELFGLRPRPSLETYFHALGPRIVAHTHALGVLLFACSTREDAPPGVKIVPYRRPGRGLAVEVKGVQGGGEATVVLLSHGVIAYANTAAEAIRRTAELDAACRRDLGELPPFEVVREPVTDLEGGGAFTSLPSRIVTDARYLCPDAVVYASTLPVKGLDAPEQEVGDALRELGRPVVLAAPDGRRVLAARNRDEIEQAREVALAHDWLEDALRARGIARYLDPAEPEQIVKMPSEQYRLRLTESRSRPSC